MDEVTIVKREVQAAEWTERIRACQESGLSIAKWCKLNNVDVRAYYYRIRKAREQIIEQIPVPINTDPSEIKPEAPLVIRLRIGEAVMDIPDGMSSETINAVVRALKC